jgi:porin
MVRWLGALVLLAGFAPLAPADAQSAGAGEVQTSAQYTGENPAGGPALKLAVTYFGDALYDVSGGARAGAMYDGRLGLILDSDLGTAFGWRGATAHLSVHAIHGTGVSGDRVGNLLVVSGIEAQPTIRLFNLWIEQRFGTGSLRVGQFTAAQEFMVSPTANLFVNSTFGWPAAFATDLPSGGPAYPLAAPGVRVQVAASKRTRLLAAVFSGDPAGPGGGDPQARDRFGLNGFRLAGRAFLIAELQQALGPGDNAPVLKLGAWRHFGHFSDLRFDPEGRSLADPASPGRPRKLTGDDAVYAVFDTPVWVAEGKQRSLHAFVRGSASPSDRNQIDRYVDAGLSLSGPLRGRSKDVLALAIGSGRISPTLSGLAGDVAAYTGAAPVRPTRETVVELTYQLQLRPNVSLQPDLQFVSRPDGGQAQANGRPLRDALVLGARTAARF